MQAYQKMAGGKYGKGPISLPETSLCKFIESDTVIYESLRKSSNLPKTCPLKKVNVKSVIDFQILGDGIM
jgi:hypothetical protein